MYQGLEDAEAEDRGAVAPRASRLRQEAVKECGFRSAVGYIADASILLLVLVELFAVPSLVVGVGIRMVNGYVVGGGLKDTGHAWKRTFSVSFAGIKTLASEKAYECRKTGDSNWDNVVSGGRREYGRIRGEERGRAEGL